MFKCRTKQTVRDKPTPAAHDYLIASKLLWKKALTQIESNDQKQALSLNPPMLNPKSNPRHVHPTRAAGNAPDKDQIYRKIAGTDHILLSYTIPMWCMDHR